MAALLLAWLCLPATGAFVAALARTSGSAGTVTVETIYVAPSGQAGPGIGTQERPFILARGGEYDLNRLVRARAESGHDVTVLFADGLYKNVQLKIIRQGIDSNSVYADDPQAPSRCDAARGNACVCNHTGTNCRVVAADYTLAAKQTTRLTLQAVHRGAAIFDGSALTALPGLVDATALTIGGARFGIVPSEVPALASWPMSNVVVDGLWFRNYRNGIAVDFAADVTVRHCTLSDIGSGLSARTHNNDYGAFAIGINGASARILFADNQVRNARNAAGGDGSDPALPSLMHSVYLQNARDILFLRNQFLGSSGPMVKFMQYPGDAEHHAFPAGIGHRRSFFVDNLFRLQTVSENGVALPPFAGQQSFVEDNAVVEMGGTLTAPTAGAVFVNNTFRNELPAAQTGSKVSLLRQEIVQGMAAPSFPGWVIAGSTISGIDKSDLVVTRYRGTALDLASIIPQPELSAEIFGHLANATELAPAEIETVIDSVIRSGTDLDQADNDAALVFVHKALW